MNEQNFKEIYKEDLSKLHAPQDLIAGTKQMVAFEEKHYLKEKKRKQYFTTFASAAALLVVCFMAFMVLRPGQTSGEHNTPIHLGNQGEQLSDAQSEVEQVTILPLEFSGADCTEQEIDGVTVKLVLSKQGYMAAFEMKTEGYVVIKSEETKEAAFMKIVQDVLAEYEE